MKTQRAPSLRSGFRLRAPATLTPARRLNLDLSSLALLDRTALGMTDQNPKGSLAALGISAAGSRYAHARKAPQPRLVLTRFTRSDGARDDSPEEGSRCVIASGAQAESGDLAFQNNRIAFACSTAGIFRSAASTSSGTRPSTCTTATASRSSLPPDLPLAARRPREKSAMLIL